MVWWEDSWARIICETLPENSYKIIAKAGVGNKFVEASVIHETQALRRAGITDIDVSVMWTFPSRLDFPLNADSPKIDLLTEYNGFGLALESYITDYIQKPPCWLSFQTEMPVVWSKYKTIGKPYVTVMKEHRKWLGNSDSYFYDTMSSILQIQNLCLSNGWSYRFFTASSFKYWFDNMSEQLEMLYLSIDWTKFTWLTENYGGMFNYMDDNRLPKHKDGCHPSREASMDVLEKVILKKFKNIYK